jgi:uncharacterized protein YigA (DUF484 family)
MSKHNDDFSKQQIETEVATYRAVSLQERQIELQRDKTKALELKLAEMVRYAQENDAIQNKLQRWVRSLLLHADNVTLPDAMIASIKSEFAMPQAALKLWGTHEQYAHKHWSQGASADVMSFAGSLTQPFCGPNTGYEASQWLSEPESAKSLAMIALRPVAGTAHLPSCYGLLVLGSSEPERFRTGMGTDFLQRIGDLGSAALARLISPTD